MPGRRGARSGRGWDAAPPRPPRTRRQPPALPTETGWPAAPDGNGWPAEPDDSASPEDLAEDGGPLAGPAQSWPSASPDDPLWSPDEATYLPTGPGDEPGAGRSERGAGRSWRGAGRGEPGGPTDGPGERGADRGESAAGRGKRGAGRGQRGGWPERGEGQREPAADRQGAGQRRGAGRWPAPKEADPSRDPAEVAREICLRQLAVRPRTRAELAAVLARNGIAAEVAASVLDRYDEVGIIDDAAFARAWVTSRHHGRGLASRALAQELRRHGVEKEQADAALEELDPETEAATARELVDRKLRSAGRTAPDALFRRLVGMLARKGYPPGVAIRVVKDALAARTEDSGFLDEIDPDAATDLVGDELGRDHPID